MRARDSRLADRLMFVVSVTTNLSQRIAGRLVQLPAPITFILSQLAVATIAWFSIDFMLSELIGLSGGPFARHGWIYLSLWRSLHWRPGAAHTVDRHTGARKPMFCCCATNPLPR